MLEFGCDDDANITRHSSFPPLSLPSSVTLSSSSPLRFAAAAVVIHGVPDLTTPEEHEWWCPFGVQVEIVMLPENGSRKSSASAGRKKSCKREKETTSLVSCEPPLDPWLDSLPACFVLVALIDPNLLDSVSAYNV